MIWLSLPYDRPIRFGMTQCRAGLMKMFSVSDLSYPLFIPKGSKAISPGSRWRIRGRS